jgi:hypothetical protein
MPAPTDAPLATTLVGLRSSRFPGLIWYALWAVFGREGPLVDDSESEQNAEVRLRYAQLLATRMLVGCVLSAFSAYSLVTIAVVAASVPRNRPRLLGNAGWMDQSGDAAGCWA